MARRGLGLLGAVVVTVATYSIVSILIQSAKVVSASDDLSARAQREGPQEHGGVVLPLRLHARPSGASSPAAGRARREGPSLRQPHEHDRVVLPLQLHVEPAAPSDSASPPPPWASKPKPHEHGRMVLPLQLHAEPATRSDNASPPPPWASKPKVPGAPECHEHHHHCHCHCHNHQEEAPPPPPPPPPPRTAPAPPRTAPAPPTLSKPTHTINNSMLVIGCLYSLISFCNPIIVFWSTGMSVGATYAFFGWLDLIANASSSLGWLLFALSQLHGEDGKVIGTTGVVVNAIGFALYATYLVVKLAVGEYMRLRDCLWVFLSFFASYVVIVLVTIYGPLKRESTTAVAISVIAFILQIISQSIPLFTVVPLLWSMLYPQIAERPEHINSRKLTVFSKVSSFGLALFWVSYCTMIYEDDLFQLANDIGAVISFLSMVLHLVYTLRPHDLDYPADA